MTSTSSALEVRSLPKAELHLHLEGTLEPEQVLRFAQRNGVQVPWETAADLAAKYDFGSLDDFLAVYYECMSTLRTREDFAELTQAYLRKAAIDGVRHAELFVDLQMHTARGLSTEDVLDGVWDGIRCVSSQLDLTAQVIVCFLRDAPTEDAMRILKALEGRVGANAGQVIGVGLDSSEAAHPPGKFATVFATARAMGLRVVAHAGEEGPAAFISEAIDVLQVERLDHGIRCLEDSSVVKRLRDAQIPLTVCPLSNVRLAVVSTMADHPIATLIREGLAVTIGSDDPAFFGGYVGENYEAVRRECGISDRQLIDLARTSVRASFASPQRKRQLLDEMDGLL